MGAGSRTKVAQTRMKAVGSQGPLEQGLAVASALLQVAEGLGSMQIHSSQAHGANTVSNRAWKAAPAGAMAPQEEVPAKYPQELPDKRVTIPR